MNIEINSLEDLESKTISLKPSEYSYVAFWGYDVLNDWDMRAQVVSNHDSNLSFFDINSYHVPAMKNLPNMDDPGWERFNILCVTKYSEDEDLTYDWRIFKGELDLKNKFIKSLVKNNTLDNLEDLLYGAKNKVYTGVAVYKSVGNIVGKKVMEPFKDVWDTL